MDSDRKYRQNGYMDSNRDSSRSERPRPQGPKLPIDVTGPRLPRLVQAVTASRCYNCATTLSVDADYTGKCPKCSAALHCCKQCCHFEPSTRYQCSKPVPVRIVSKDQTNQCELFTPRVTVAREATPAQANGNGSSVSAQPARSSNDARAAFANLFKK